MKEQINAQYCNMYNNSIEFRRFVLSMENIPTNDIIAKYDINKEIISYCFGLSEKPTSKQAVV